MKLASIDPAVWRRFLKMVDGRTDNGRTAEHAYTISSPMSLKAQVSQKVKQVLLMILTFLLRLKFLDPNMSQSTTKPTN